MCPLRTDEFCIMALTELPDPFAGLAFRDQDILLLVDNVGRFQALHSTQHVNDDVIVYQW